MTKTEYRYTGTIPENLDDGSGLEPLQKIALTEEQLKGAHAARLLSAGLLVEIKKPATKAGREE